MGKESGMWPWKEARALIPAIIEIRDPATCPNGTTGLFRLCLRSIALISTTTRGALSAPRHAHAKVRAAARRSAPSVVDARDV